LKYEIEVEDNLFNSNFNLQLDNGKVGNRKKLRISDPALCMVYTRLAARY
jgi:hypothetical protein